MFASSQLSFYTNEKAAKSRLKIKIAILAAAPGLVRFVALDSITKASNSHTHSFGSNVEKLFKIYK